MRDCAADAVFRVRFRKSGFFPKIGPGDMRREETAVCCSEHCQRCVAECFRPVQEKNHVSMAGRYLLRFPVAG